MLRGRSDREADGAKLFVAAKGNVAEFVRLQTTLAADTPTGSL
jgi:hypothetical protein